ncbi:MAG: DNA polymerase III subunit alpha [Anaerolineales bacterium]|nr:DNA polymerase III subunit alpha [Anaerolineales bacterium]
MDVGTPAYLSCHPRAVPFAELHAHSDHSLLDGVCSPEELAARAAELGLPALALTDHDGLYGAVRFVRAAQEVGLKPILGAEMTLTDETHLTLLIENARGYTNLCRLVTLARKGREKGVSRLARADLAAHAEGLIALSGCRRGEIAQLLLAGQAERAMEVAQGYRRVFGPENFCIELQYNFLQGDARLAARLSALALRAGLDVVATSNAHYIQPAQHEVHDVLTCTRLHTTLEDAGTLLRPNAEAILRSPQEMAVLFARIPVALETSVQIAQRCVAAQDYLPNGPQILPRFPVPTGSTPDGYLRLLCLQALAQRHPGQSPDDLLDWELAIIKQLGLAEYFLIVWDICRFARRRGIRCQGRGSAANSLVAYLLGITSIDPRTCGLVFERFLSPERASPPDIDIDFAADRREEVIQYVYQRYGEQHAAMACTLVTYRTRSAVRDAARALGFPPALVERLGGMLHDARDADQIERSRNLVTSFDPELAGRLFQALLRITPQMGGIPRHLGIHNGGMVLTGPPLCEAIPLEPATMPDRVVTQWDKDALDNAGLIKIDLLGLRMLSAIEDAVTIIEAQTGTRIDLDSLPPDDSRVYDMLCAGQTIGVFQVESRAQASLIPQFQPRNFADLVVEISLIRPGPIQANMVHPYLNRRRGLTEATYAHPLLQPALEETLGVIVFQEQVIKVARDLAGFSPGRAELLRRALSHKLADERLRSFHEEFVTGAMGRGVPRRTAERVFEQLQAFGGYAFPKSHAAAFAVLTYQSAWLRCYYPAAFFGGLLRHQPMGFYPPHVIVSEARRFGVTIEPIDIEHSALAATVHGNALRLGLGMVTGLGEDGGQSIVDARRQGPFRSLVDFCCRTRLGRRAVEALIWSGAFDVWEIPRRQLLWNLQAALELSEDVQSRLALPATAGEHPRFGFLSPRGRLWTELAHTGVSASSHITTLISARLKEIGTTPSLKLPELKDGHKVWIGGVVVSAQRPPTAKGTAFLALEDEGGLMNVILKPEVYEASRKDLKAPFVVIQGRVQKRGQAINIIARRIVRLEVEME